MAKKVWQAGSEIRAVNETDRQGGKPGRKVKKPAELSGRAAKEVITPNGNQKSQAKRKATAGRRGRMQPAPSGAECPEKPTTAGRHGQKQTPGAAMRTKKLVLALALVLLFDLVLGAFCFTVLFLRPSAGFGHRAQVVVIPDASGADEAAARALFSPTDGDGALYSLSFQYEYADAPRGVVLSQVPAAGVRRKAVPGMRPCPVTLCVSLGKKTVVVPELGREGFAGGGSASPFARLPGGVPDNGTFAGFIHRADAGRHRPGDHPTGRDSACRGGNGRCDSESACRTGGKRGDSRSQGAWRKRGGIPSACRRISDRAGDGSTKRRRFSRIRESGRYRSAIRCRDADEARDEGRFYYDVLFSLRGAGDRRQAPAHGAGGSRRIPLLVFSLSRFRFPPPSRMGQAPGGSARPESTASGRGGGHPYGARSQSEPSPRKRFPIPQRGVTYGILRKRKNTARTRRTLLHPPGPLRRADGQRGTTCPGYSRRFRRIHRNRRGTVLPARGTRYPLPRKGSVPPCGNHAARRPTGVKVRYTDASFTRTADGKTPAAPPVRSSPLPTVPTCGSKISLTGATRSSAPPWQTSTSCLSSWRRLPPHRSSMWWTS